MKRKLLVFLIATVAICMCMFTFTACGGKEPPHTHAFENRLCVCGETQGTEGLEYELNLDGKSYSVIGIGEAVEEDVIAIPSKYNDLPVTRIGVRAFMATNITTAILGKNVKIIDDSAFYSCEKLTNVFLQEGLEEIVSLAFADTAITNISIPNSVTTLTSASVNSSRSGVGAFLGCDNLVFNVKDGLNYLGNEENPYLWLIDISRNVTDAVVDDNCKYIAPFGVEGGIQHLNMELKTLQLPKNLVKVDWFYSYTPSLTYKIKDGLSYLGSEDNEYFYLAKADSDITTALIDDNCKFIGYQAFSSCSSLTSIEIPNSVTSIGDSALVACSSLTSIEIPDSVTSIGDGAFGSCDSLASVSIGNGVRSIGAEVFYYCISLTNIEVAEDNAYYKDIDGNLYTKDGETLIQYAIGKTATTFTIPNSVTAIGERAFNYCESLTNVEIPNSVTSIGDMAFRNCSNLTDIYCEAENKPGGWDDEWFDYWNATVHWGYKGE